MQMQMQDKRQPWLSPGNSKLGPVPVWNLPAGPSCPGKTAWCGGSVLKKPNCYATRGHFTGPAVKNKYVANYQRLIAPGGLEAFVREVPLELRAKAASLCRIHASGDFFSQAYVEAWTRIVEASPRVSFWAYTRSYAVASMLPALEVLRSLPNMQLFASVDHTTKIGPPRGWRVAGIEGTPGFNGVVCPEQRGIYETCAECRLCPEPTKNEWNGWITFRVHSGAKV